MKHILKSFIVVLGVLFLILPITVKAESIEDKLILSEVVDDNVIVRYIPTILTNTTKNNNTIVADIIVPKTILMLPKEQAEVEQKEIKDKVNINLNSLLFSIMSGSSYYLVGIDSYIYSSTDENSDIIAIIPKGCIVEVKSIVNADWVKVHSSIYDGYVKTDVLDEQTYQSMLNAQVDKVRVDDWKFIYTEENEKSKKIGYLYKGEPVFLIGVNKIFEEEVIEGEEPKLKECWYNIRTIKGIVGYIHTDKELDQTKNYVVAEQYVKEKEIRRSIIESAIQLEGRIPYVWGGKPSTGGINSQILNGGGYDCSGFVCWSYMTANELFNKEFCNPADIMSTYAISRNAVEKDILTKKPADIGMIVTDGTIYTDVDGTVFYSPDEATKSSRKIKYDILQAVVKDVVEQKKQELLGEKEVKIEIVEKQEDKDEKAEEKIIVDKDKELDAKIKSYMLNNSLWSIIYNKEFNEETIDEMVSAFIEEAEKEGFIVADGRLTSADSTRTTNHCGIYVGDNKEGNPLYIHCTGGGVKISEYDFKVAYEFINLS